MKTIEDYISLFTNKYPLYMGNLDNISFIETNIVDNFKVNNNNILYNSLILDTITDELFFLFAHELFHIINGDQKESVKHNKLIWDITSDLYINDFLVASGLLLPDNQMYYKDTCKFTKEELYNYLNNLSNIPYTVNNHDLWNKIISFNNINELDDDYVVNLTGINYGELEDIKLNYSSIHGDIITNSFGKINSSDNNLNWKKLLKDSMKTDWYNDYASLIIEDGFIKPSRFKNRKPSVEVLLDTSGSVSEQLLKNFLMELKKILKGTLVKVGCFDTRFYGFTTVNNQNDIDDLLIKGRGGTNYNIAISSFSKDVCNRIIFTDGEAEMPYQELDVIWIVYGNRIINPLGGKVIYLNQVVLSENKPYLLKK